jgi:hypothetical protein
MVIALGKLIFMCFLDGLQYSPSRHCDDFSPTPQMGQMGQDGLRIYNLNQLKSFKYL